MEVAREVQKKDVDNRQNDHVKCSYYEFRVVVQIVSGFCYGKQNKRGSEFTKGTYSYGYEKNRHH